MKILLSILAHEQNQYIFEMLLAVKRLDPMPEKCIYIMDRPSEADWDDAVERFRGTCVEPVRFDEIPAHVGRPQMAPTVEYFMAGAARNKAIGLMAEFGCDGIVFIDGDCIPESGLIGAHAEVMSSGGPIATVGKRRDELWKYDDQRMASPDSPVHIFSDTPNRVTNEFYFVDSGVVWTCNFGLNKEAVDMLKNLNNRLYGRSEVFSTDFMGTWGGEDGFLGLECYYGGIPVWTLPDGKNGIVHKPHPRPIEKYEHHTFINFLESRREDLMYRLKLIGAECPDFVPKSILKRQLGVR